MKKSIIVVLLSLVLAPACVLSAQGSNAVPGQKTSGTSPVPSVTQAPNQPEFVTPRLEGSPRSGQSPSRRRRRW